MIVLHNISKVYRTDMVETLALSEINLTVESGEFVSVMGPSGSGKSTLLHIMGLIDVPTGGEVRFSDRQITKWQDRELARIRNHKFGFIFQSFHLINDLSVIDNVELPLLYRRVSNTERRKMAIEALDRVGLIPRKFHYPSQLSGGQRQRVAIARAIVGRPEIILADEPTGNLDSAMGQEIMNILLGLNKADGTTVVMVTHDDGLARQTQRIVRLFDGMQVM